MKSSKAEYPTPDDSLLIEVFRHLLLKADRERPIDRKFLPPMAGMPALTRRLHRESVREFRKAGYRRTAAEVLATGYVQGRAQALAEAFVVRLRARFGRLPRGTLARVNGLLRFPDDAVLDRLTKRLATATSLDEVLTE